MIAAIDAMLDATAGDPPVPGAQDEISALTERRLRLIVLALPQRRSGPAEHVTPRRPGDGADTVG